MLPVIGWRLRRSRQARELECPGGRSRPWADVAFGDGDPVRCRPCGGMRGCMGAGSVAVGVDTRKAVVVKLQ